jgi:hypothetical protein
MRLVNLGNGLEHFSQEKRRRCFLMKIGHMREHGEDTIMLIGLAEYITNNGIGEELVQIDAYGDPDCTTWVHPKRIMNSKSFDGNMGMQ